MIRQFLVVAVFVATVLIAFATKSLYGQVVAQSTWATNIAIEPQPRDVNGVPIGSPSSAAFDDWDDIPVAVSDPADNPSPLNILDIADIKIANDESLLYIYVSGHEMRTNGLNIAFDTDQDISTGFNIFGLSLVGSELAYVNDFVYEQRTSFNDNKTNGAPDPGGLCCTGGPLDVNNGGALLYPGWDVEFGEREWAIPLDAVWSVNQPFGPTFPNTTFNFMVWTDQGIQDISEVITYTLAEAPDQDGDFDNDGDVDAADYVAWHRVDSTPAGYALWRANFGKPDASAASSSLVPEPATGVILACAAICFFGVRRRNFVQQCWSG